MKSLHGNSLAMAVSAVALAVALGADGMVANVAFADIVPARIVRAPDDLPRPLARRAAHPAVELEAVELLGQLDDGATYRYWTFDGKVPGPMVRVRVGDPVEVTMRNPADSWVMHNVDFHAATGPGGGASRR